MFVLQNRQDGLYLAQNYCGWTEDLNCAKIFDTVKDAGLRRGEDFTLRSFLSRSRRSSKSVKLFR